MKTLALVADLVLARKADLAMNGLGGLLTGFETQRSSRVPNHVLACVADLVAVEAVLLYKRWNVGHLASTPRPNHVSIAFSIKIVLLRGTHLQLSCGNTLI